MGNLLSTNSSPALYEGITLLLADPEKPFPEEFDPQRPYKTRLLGKLSRQTFVKCVERETGAYVVAVENFNPTGVVNKAPEEVELRDRATYIVITRDSKTTEKRFESIEVWQKNQTSGDERMLVQRAMKELELNHTNVRP
ncbi:hypothetical protein NADE_007858 [Nannochloris sp. 'desiccata']|nr:hypothetical protein NADE_007858 [Chlorella desiccata (nom. nud.)]